MSIQFPLPDIHSLTESSAREDGSHPIRVAVSVDLQRGAGTGGHMRFWERIAEAASGLSRAIDLTVHVQGDGETTESLDSNVRFVTHRPGLSTRGLSGLRSVADHTDLAPHHFGLARRLVTADILHTTDCFFAHAATCRRVARLAGKPLVTSLHTDVPAYTRHFSGQLLKRWLPDGLGSLAVEQLDVPGRLERHMERKIHRHYAASDWVLASVESHRDLARSLGAGARPLRRGIDLATFCPVRRDRPWLFSQYGIPLERIVLMCSGRVSSGKNIHVLRDMMIRLLGEGRDVHLLLAGRIDHPMLLDGIPLDRLTLTGPLGLADLGRTYASADIFTFPSAIEVAPNAVQEALASGLPCILHRDGGGRATDGRNGEALLLDSADPARWSDAVRNLLDDPVGLKAMSAAARQFARHQLPDWRTVLTEDLLPVWRRALEEKLETSRLVRR
jgi:glycosyltransferase involved in cell wall biosynthesis